MHVQKPRATCSDERSIDYGSKGVIAIGKLDEGRTELVIGSPMIWQVTDIVFIEHKWESTALRINKVAPTKTESVSGAVEEVKSIF